MAKESELSKLKKGISKEEETLKSEVKKEEKGLVWFFKSHTFRILLATIIFIAAISVVIYLTSAQGKIYIEKSEISAPVITLSSTTPGILEKVFVKEGDIISSGTTVAQVSGESIKAQISGLVIFVQNTPGQLVSSQTPIVKMIDPEESRVIGHIQEDKGLIDIKSGQEVIFTVDAFGSEKFNGIVESIVPTSRDSAISFSISDKRPEKEFDVKVRYDVSAYDQFKNGMSAKMWIYK